MARRLLRWSILNLVFGLMPFGAAVFVSWVMDKMSSTAVQDNLSEVLFFSVMLCAISIGDLMGCQARARFTITWFEILQWTFVLGMLISAVLYGVFRSSQIAGSSAPAGRLTWLAVLLACSLTPLSIINQVLLYRVIDSVEEGS